MIWIPASHPKRVCNETIPMLTWYKKENKKNDVKNAMLFSLSLIPGIWIPIIQKIYFIWRRNERVPLQRKEEREKLIIRVILSIYYFSIKWRTGTDDQGNSL